MDFTILFIGEFLSDINLILKIFVLMTLVSWVKNHLGSTPLSWIIVAGLGYFILFDGWAIFGPVYILYLLLMFGISGVIIDFFFVGGGQPEGKDGMESPVSSGVDIAHRMQHAARMRRGG